MVELNVALKIVFLDNKNLFFGERMDIEAVDKRIFKMTQFIVQEAEEKASEILASAIEEAELQKTKLMQAERLKLNMEFNKCEMKLKAAKKIKISTAINKARLEILNTQEKLVQSILHETSKHLKSLTKGDNYQQLLINLVVQGMIKLNKPNITIKVRQEDVQLIKSLIPKILNTYTKSSNNSKTINLIVNETEFVRCTGGVVLTALENRIICDNTLDTRLLYAYNISMPKIRSIIFPNPKTTLITQ